MNRLQTRSRPLQTALLLGAAVLLSACGDAPTEPNVLLVAPETAPALRLDPEVPTLPGVIDDVVGEGTPTLDRSVLARAERLWRDAERARGGEPDAGRDSAYALAAPRLAEVVDSAELASYRQRLEHWIDAASGAVPRGGIAGISGALRDASELLARTESRWAQGDAAGAIEALLRASDRLVDVTPRGVARRLIRAAEAARSRWADPGSEAEGERTTAFRRAGRLIDGAYDALADGDHARAIQRAYYAAQLLEER